MRGQIIELDDDNLKLIRESETDSKRLKLKVKNLWIHNDVQFCLELWLQLKDTLCTTVFTPSVVLK